VVSRTLFDTRGKAKDIEEYLRPIITKRLERDIDSDDFDPDSVIQSPSEYHLRWAHCWYRTIWSHGCGAPRMRVNAQFTTSLFDWFGSTLLPSLPLQQWVIEFSASGQDSTLLCKVLTHILFDLATYNLYIEPLREEISTIVETEGWNKVSMEKMRKLDSFMKESHRLNGSGFGGDPCDNLNDNSKYSNSHFQLWLDDWQWATFLSLMALLFQRGRILLSPVVESIRMRWVKVDLFCTFDGIRGILAVLRESARIPRVPFRW